MSALADDLRARSDADLARLLVARPDLATPAPSSVVAMATRAGTRTSVERALASLTRFELQVAEALVALAHGTARPGPVPTAALEAGVGVDPAPATDRLRALALVTAGPEGLTPVPALAEAFGPHPAGLGPSLAVLDALHPRDRATSSPTTPARLADVLADAPDGARRVLDALTWGPPTGTVEEDVGPGSAWLLARGVLRRLSPTHLALPREVALAARGGQLIRDVAPRPPEPDPVTRPGAVVAAESAAAADRVVAHVTAVLAAWDDAPPAVLRAGGLAAREVRRLAVALGVPPEEATFAVEVAAMAGLVGPWSGGDAATWRPTEDADAWLALDLPGRWARVAHAWAASTRVPWLITARGPRDAPRTALGGDLDRWWAPVLRRRVLAALAGVGEGAVPTAAEVHAILAWSVPRATPTLEAVEAILGEASWLGLVGAGALAGAGRAMLGPDAGSPPSPDATDDVARLAAALEADLPPLVREVVIQADLTGLVPGRPDRALADLLAACADEESRGAAVSVRFTAASVARALDSGLHADDLLAGLRSHSRTGLPQPLEYVIRDEARRHGRLRVGAAGAYLRSDDDTALAAVLARPELSYLRLRRLAPTVLLSPEPAAVLLEALRDAGVAAVLEGPDGTVLSLRPQPPRASGAGARRRPAPSSGGVPAPLRPEAVEAVVAAMRAGDDRAGTTSPPGTSAAPAHALARLRDAAGAGDLVVIALAGATGVVERRVVRPVSVDAGRVRVVDVARLAELTVAVHRIIDVAPFTAD